MVTGVSSKTAYKRKWIPLRILKEENKNCIIFVTSHILSCFNNLRISKGKMANQLQVCCKWNSSTWMMNCMQLVQVHSVEYHKQTTTQAVPDAELHGLKYGSFSNTSSQ